MAVNLLTILTSTGIPVAYRRFKKKQVPPYAIYYLLDTENFAADGKVYLARENFKIELYSCDRDLVSEGKIETALNANEIFWEKDTTYIADEQLELVVYDLQI